MAEDEEKVSLLTEKVLLFRYEVSQAKALPLIPTPFLRWSISMT